tara:strand:+ start:2652 stop:4334 length:1683 start_codon:yes stop_codon:yes gene_type:complete
MAIKLYQSQAQVDTKSNNVQSGGALNISPSTVYNASKAQAAAADSMVKLGLLIKQTKDKNKSTSIKGSIKERMGMMMENLSNSGNPDEIGSYETVSKLFKDGLVVNENTAVKNQVNSWFSSEVQSNKIDLFKTIRGNVINEKIANDKIMLAENQKIIGTSNNGIAVQKAKDEIANFLGDNQNSLYYKPGEWKTLQYEQNEKIQQNAAIMLATNNPGSLIDNPDIITKNVKDPEAVNYIMEKAYEQKAINAESELADNAILDAKNLDDQAVNFTMMAERIKDFNDNSSNSDYSENLISYKEIKAAYVNNDIDETMFNKLINYRAGTTNINETVLVEAINDEILTSNSPVELQDLSKRIQVKDSDLTFLNLGAAETSNAVRKINALKKDSTLYNDYKDKLGIVKAVFFASESFDFEVGEGARSIASIGVQAMNHFDRLVMNENVNVDDALISTIRKFNPGKALPNLTIFPLPFKMAESNWSKAISDSSFFSSTRKSLTNSFKEKQLNFNQYVEEMDNLDNAEKLFGERYKYALSDPTIEDKMGFASGQSDAFGNIISNLLNN